jgi:hypothetical protein
VVTSALSLLAGFLSAAVNTGSILNVKTIPKPWLPYLALAGSFVVGCGASLGGHPLTAATIYTAILAGVGALITAGGGAAVHGLVTAHLTSRGVAATEAASPVPPVVMVTPTSAITKPDSVKITEKIGPAIILALIVGLTVFAPNRDVPCATAADSGQSPSVTPSGTGTRPLCFMAAEGCSWWSANSKPVVTDLGSIASCVLAQLFQGISAPLTIVGSCIGATVADVEEIVASIVQFYDQPDAGATNDAGLAVAMWHSSRFDADIVLHVPPTVDKPTLARLHAARAN